jgi:hypothetical protein
VAVELAESLSCAQSLLDYRVAANCPAHDDHMVLLSQDGVTKVRLP